MNIKISFKSLILMLILVMFTTTSYNIAYSYFDGLNSSKNSNLPIGEWMTPISTAQEFYDAVSVSSNEMYYIVNDIDFSGFSWTINSSNYNSTFSGILDGGGHILSNLTISVQSTSYTNLGIFPIFNGGSIKNITFDNINMYYDINSLFTSSLRSGILAGTVTGENNVFENITIIDGGVRGSSDYGAGGIIGFVTGSTTTLTINNIKGDNIRVFNKYSNVGGIIGNIDSNVSNVSISNIDITGEVYSDDSNAYSGGIVGVIWSNSNVLINNAIIDMQSRNTLETSYSYYMNYSSKYLGGIIGLNYSSSSNLSITNTFFTGSLVTDSKTKRYYVGTLIGSNPGTYTESNNYYSMVEFRQKNNSINYYPDSSSNGVFSDIVSYYSMPSASWWNSFYSQFDYNIWSQDYYGRLYLNR